MEQVKCPNCGDSYYAEKYTMSTVMYSPTIWKNGVMQYDNNNYHTTECECLNCHYQFSYTTQGGKITNISLGKKVNPSVPLQWADEIVYNETKQALPSVIVSSQQDERDAEIKRLETQIETLQQQLQEVRANPEWRMGVYLDDKN